MKFFHEGFNVNAFSNLKELERLIFNPSFSVRGENMIFDEEDEDETEDDEDWEDEDE